MDGRTISGKDLFSSWSAAASPVPKDSGLNSFDMFAIDLLHAELRLKLCDREDFTNTDFDGDCSFVSMAVPNLVTVVNEIERHSIWGNKPSWASLKSRCYWLIANFYLWRGRSSNNIRESRTAEEEGLSWIKKTKSCLRDNCPILTPHLGSPRRKQSVWKAITIESLTTFVFEVQAASVVVLAQEQFLKVTSKYTSFEAKVPLDQTDLGIFSSIGESLLERYTGDCEANFTELIDDFIATHGKQLYEKTSRNQKVDLSTDDSFRHWFDVLFPNVILETGADVVSLSNPCILTILVSCLRTKEENWSRIINLFVQFTLALFDRTNLLLVNLKLSTDRNATADSVSSSDSDDSQIDVVDNPQGHKKMERNADTVRLQQCTTLIPLLLTTILKVCKNGIPDDDKWNLAQSSDFIALLNSSLSFVANWFQNSQFMESDIGSQGADRDIYVAAQAIFRVVSPPTHSEETPQNGAVQRHVSKLFKIIISQQHALSMLSNDNGRNERLRQTRQQADLIAHVCCDLGVLLSQFPVHVVNGTMKRSIVFGDLTSKSPHLTHFAMFCDSLLWLWKGATGADGVSHMTSEKVCLERARSCPTFDAFSRERLRVPVATVIVGLCGSAASTSRLLDEKSNIEEQMTITEICDSDESVTEWLFGEDSTCDGKCEELLRVITHVVHCVNQVFGKIDEKEACSFAHVENYVTACGPCLPLVVARVVNQFASHLLLDCGDGKEGMPSSLWSDYTFGCRTVGHLLDAVLYKAYKCLHGFTLTCDVKESATLTANSGFSKGMPQFIPESKEAAAMLYRCITRAYSQGRRSPPKAALDAVSAALPAVKRSEKSKIIRTFLFSVDARNVTAEKLATVATQHTNDDANFSFVLDFDASRSDNSSCEECEDTIVRRGLVKLIAQGPLPRVQDSTNENEWRTCAQQAEEDLSTKFFAVLDHLCFGDVNDNECWFKGYQCLSMKADLIADRLGLSAGFARTPQFYATDRSRRARSTLDINDLEYFHEHEAMRSEQGWLRCLGNDLSVFVRYCWSSFSSLRLCSAEIGRLIDLSERGNDTEHNSKTKASAWKAIQSFLTTKDFVRWQEAWGGIFVASLRIAAYRCLSLSLLASYMKEDATPTDILFRSEVTEALGVSLYSEMMGSQSYGYPMSEMTTLRKRSLCMAAKSCFQYAMKLVDLDDQESNGRVTWDLCFMVGKVRRRLL